MVKLDKGQEEFEKLVEDETAKQNTVRVLKSLRKEGKPPLDWWSKYYYSQGLTQKAPGFEEWVLKGLWQSMVGKCIEFVKVSVDETVIQLEKTYFIVVRYSSKTGITVC